MPEVVIIGAGMTGILMAIKLREAGIHKITILEKKDKLGGTWRENTYPGVACDIPAHMYTYSFEPNPEWSHRFAHGAEIQQYFERVSDKYGVTSLIRFNEQVTSCVFEDAKWHIETSKDEKLEADFVISATGILHYPAKPDIPGIESFQGKMFHTAEWDHSTSISGKRVGIIGTGSTAAQVIPELVKDANKVSVFQRTPQWIVNLPNKDFSDKLKRRWRSSPVSMHRLREWYTFGVEQTFSKAVIGKRLQHALVNAWCRLNLRFNVKDPELRKKLTPDYRVGCKRIIVNTTFYDAIQKPNADLVTEGIECITPQGVKTKDGKENPLDVLVLSTGFKPFNFMRPMNLVGKNGVSIDERWKGKVQAYRSLLIPDFPNFFLMLGPNTPIGNFSVIAMSEVQSQYVLKLIAAWRRKEFDEVSASDEALKSFNEYLKAGMNSTVWLGGCNSWYLDDDGDPAMWPYSWKQWVKEMDEPVMGDLILGFTENKKSTESSFQTELDAAVC
jgi:cation diffusion facilitator CzcD-associated flavoprotein CzcO